MTSQYNPAHPLTRLKSENFGVQPTELPIPTRKRARKSPKGSDSETLSSSSSISSNTLQSQPSTPQIHIIVQEDKVLQHLIPNNLHIHPQLLLLLLRQWNIVNHNQGHGPIQG